MTAVRERIDVMVNGKRREVGAGTLLDLLAELTLDPRSVVVEHNSAIVRRAALGEVRLRAGDAIELVHFVGGG